jgi:hypothetical protein
MHLLERIKDLFRMIFGAFLEGAEESVPLERRLAYDRVKRAENVKKQMKSAEDVGAAAELMVQQLAEARIVAANLRQEAKAHLQAAASAAARGDDVTRQQEESRAVALSEELAMADDEVHTLEQFVADALSDKQEAISMVLEQSKELEKLARGDARLVARARMTEMRRQQLQLREQMMELVPNDQSNMRARIDEKVNHDEARYRARKDVVDAMWKQKRTAATSRTLSTSAAGAAVLDELKREVGYVTAAPATAAPTGQAAEAAGEFTDTASTDSAAAG